ncbi:hypothetical protein A8F02_33720, partial [Burkholderia cenocepacia]
LGGLLAPVTGLVNSLTPLGASLTGTVTTPGGNLSGTLGGVLTSGPVGTLTGALGTPAGSAGATGTVSPGGAAGT